MLDLLMTSSSRRPNLPFSLYFSLLFRKFGIGDGFEFDCIVSQAVQSVRCAFWPHENRFLRVRQVRGVSDWHFSDPCAWIWCIGGASLRSSFFNFRFEVPQTGSINDRYRFANRVRSAAVRSTLTEEPHIGLCLTYILEQGIKIAADCELGLNVTNETLGHEGVQSLL